MQFLKRMLTPFHCGLTSVLLVLCVIVSLLFYWSYKKVQSDNVRIVKMEQELKLFKDREVRRLNIGKTLKVNFGLSDYEAKYYAIMFDDFSTLYNIPWEVYPSVIRIESNFRTTLVSSEGAKGIGQVLEPTAKIVAKKIGINYKEGETLWNEILNMAITLTYLSDGVKEEGVQNGIKRYLGGPSFRKTAQYNKAAGAYMGSYQVMVWQEYIKCKLLYKGISVYPDSVDDLISSFDAPLISDTFKVNIQ